MRYLIPLLILSSSLFGNSGARILKHKDFDSYTHSGYLQTFESDFTDLLQVNGSLRASRCQVYELQVNGEASLHECVIHGSAFIKGEIICDHSVFQGPISLTCKSATINRCAITQDIEVSNVGNFKGTQIIKMTNGSVVQGNIKFESKKGEVHLSKDSRVCGGVIGGHIRLFAD